MAHKHRSRMVDWAVVIQKTLFSRYNLVLIIFICEKLLSTEAVETGIVRQILARVLKFGNIDTIIVSDDISFNCFLNVSLGCLDK